MAKQRNVYIDLVKGILIILVVLGHSIQFFQYNNSPLFWNSILFKFIYTFHMPLFIGISGYFAYSSIQKTTTFNYIKSRIKYLLVPLVMWCLIMALIFEIPKSVNFISFIQILLQNIIHSYWFIWVIIWGSVTVSLMKKYSLDKPIPLLFISIIVMFISSDFFRIDVGRSFLIYFILGYLLASRDIQRIHEFCKRYLLVFVVLFLVGFIVWNPFLDFFSPISLKSWAYFLFRVFLGIISSITILELIYYIFNKLKENKIVLYFSKIGQETLGIYLMQDIIISACMLWVIPYITCPMSSLIYIIPSLVITISCYYFIRRVSKFRITGFLLFGKKI